MRFFQNYSKLSSFNNAVSAMRSYHDAAIAADPAHLAWQAAAATLPPLPARPGGQQQRAGIISRALGTQVKTDKLEFEAGLARWLGEASETERPAREAACDAIRDIQRNKGKDLELSHLTSLPAALKYLKSVTRLTVTDSNIAVIDNLPPNLFAFEANNIGLNALASTPPNLHILKLNDNALMALPPLPPTLHLLEVSNNRC